MRLATSRLATLLALSVSGCTAADLPDEMDIEDGIAVEDGKEDNYLSFTAKEFVLEGTTRITTTAGATEADVKKLVGLKHIAVAWFINQYLVDKEHEDANASYGGFGAMAKGGSFEEANLHKV